MTSVNIVCNDNVGVSCTHNSTQISFYIESKYTSDNTKLKFIIYLKKYF